MFHFFHCFGKYFLFSALCVSISVWMVDRSSLCVRMGNFNYIYIAFCLSNQPVTVRSVGIMVLRFWFIVHKLINFFKICSLSFILFILEGFVLEFSITLPLSSLLSDILFLIKSYSFWSINKESKL